jgi:hypothetical protein
MVSHVSQRLCRPRASLPSHQSAVEAEPPALSAKREACVAMCATAQAAVESWGGASDAARSEGSNRQCLESCLRGSLADPHVKTPGEESEASAAGRKVKVDLPWFPRRVSSLAGESPHVKHLSWVPDSGFSSARVSLRLSLCKAGTRCA